MFRRKVQVWLEQIKSLKSLWFPFICTNYGLHHSYTANTSRRRKKKNENKCGVWCLNVVLRERRKNVTTQCDATFLMIIIIYLRDLTKSETIPLLSHVCVFCKLSVLSNLVLSDGFRLSIHPFNLSVSFNRMFFIQSIELGARCAFNFMLCLLTTTHMTYFLNESEKKEKKNTTITVCSLLHQIWLKDYFSLRNFKLTDFEHPLEMWMKWAASTKQNKKQKKNPKNKHTKIVAWEKKQTKSFHECGS